MATFAFKPYTYVPTPPRRKSAITDRKAAPKQASIFHKLQQSSSGTAPTIVVANNNGNYKPGVQVGTSKLYGGSDHENKNNEDDCDIPPIEELLLANLQEQGFTSEDRGNDKRGGVEGLASEERGSSADQF